MRQILISILCFLPYLAAIEAQDNDGIQQYITSGLSEISLKYFFSTFPNL